MCVLNNNTVSKIFLQEGEKYSGSEGKSLPTIPHCAKSCVYLDHSTQRGAQFYVYTSCVQHCGAV